jgi:hypothetical protein
VPKLLATYSTGQAARDAVRVLQDAGVPTTDIYMNASEDDRDVAEADMHDEVNEAVFGPGAIVATRATKRAAVGGSVIGIIIGGTIGLIVGIVFLRQHWFTIIASLIAFGAAGWVAFALWSMYAAGMEEQEAEEIQTEHQIVVGVHTENNDELARAEQALRRTEPRRLDLAS